jgi:AAA15 family ATPase/GTPase
MLIEFTVKNFKSLRDEQTLSMVASNYFSENKDDLIKKDIPGMSKYKFLPCSVILGSNASGKTSLLQAIATLQRMVLSSFEQKPGYGLLYAPFRLDKKHKNEPTEFTIVFEVQTVRFEYSVSYTQSTVISESLAAFPKAREQLWFERNYNHETKQSKCKTHSRYLNVPTEITELLRDDTLFLSLLIRLNYESIKQIASWFTNQLAVVDRTPDVPQEPLRNYSIDLLDGKTGTDEMRRKMKDIIREADFGILDGEVVKAPAPEIPVEWESLLPPDFKDADWKTVQFIHQGEDGTHTFSYDEESAGTKRLFEIAGPIIDVLESGKTVLIDEMDASMHPLLVREIVGLFQSHKTNPYNAQLLFTAHDSNVLEHGLLRRDQIWFTKKRRDGSSVLYPLSDYKIRTRDAIASGYLVGRYDAIPVIPKLFGLDEKLSTK